jgi:hypothetical protein
MTRGRGNRRVRASRAETAQRPPARASQEIADDKSNLVIRNPGADATPARAPSQSRTFTVTS